MSEAWRKAKKLDHSYRTDKQLEAYQNNPRGFMADILGDKFFTDDVDLLMKSVCENRITLARSGNGVGKSWTDARLGIWFLLAYSDSKVFLTAAPPESNLVNIVWAHILRVSHDKPTLFSSFTSNRLKISRHSESFIQGLAIPLQGTVQDRESKFSGKHSPHLLFVVDEGDAVPQEVYRGIDGCMSSGFARLLILFNPRSPQGHLADLEKSGGAHVVEMSALRHPNVVTGIDIIPGAVSREVTVKRFNKWTRPLAAGEQADSSCVEVPAFLVNQVAPADDGRMYPPLMAGFRKITSEEFWYMVLGKYPNQGSQQLIAQEWIDRARVNYDMYVARFGERPPEGVRPKMGVDLADLGGDNNSCCMRYGDYVAPFQAWGGIDPDLSASKAFELYRQFNAEYVYVDSLGIGAACAPRVYRIGKEKNVDVVVVGVKVSEKPTKMTKTDIGDFYSIRDELWWRVRDWLEKDPNAMLPPDQLLLEELRTATYETASTGGKIKIMKKEEFRDKLKRSPDRADALCLTFYPYERATVLSLDV